MNEVVSRRIGSNVFNRVRSSRLHWPEYLMEAGELGLYMLFTCAAATLFQHPASPVRYIIVSDIGRRMLTGLAMGITAIALVMSPWGRQSGAHFNPAVTFTFYRLGKVQSWDAWFYIVAQFVGALGGVAIATYALRGAPSNPAVRYAVTEPGVYGDVAALSAEFTISFISMSTVLFVSNSERIAHTRLILLGR